MPNVQLLSFGIKQVMMAYADKMIEWGSTLIALDSQRFGGFYCFLKHIEACWFGQGLDVPKCIQLIGFIKVLSPI